ncbi:MAG: hypothetical protein WBL23_07410, partial [Salinisphaera sp.]|uniref:hypothetical protein n=1 Tax=Salinisphaera sp. TaxID=1914330 RepID=UPI003C7B8D28
VDGLFRNGAQAFGNAVMHLFDGGVGVADQPVKDSVARGGDPQPAFTQFGNDGNLVSTHGPSIIGYFLERVNKTNASTMGNGSHALSPVTP